MKTQRQAFTDFYQRTDGQLPALFTTDEYAAYLAAMGLGGLALASRRISHLLLR